MQHLKPVGVQEDGVDSIWLEAPAQAKGKGKAKDHGSDSEADRFGWWTSWLLGAAGTESGSGLGLGVGVGRARSEERYAYGSARGAASAAVGTWSMRHGYGGSVEEWGV